MSNLKPTASGTLKATPMASLLVYALDKRMTGTMVFESSAGGRSAVQFLEGAPTKAKTHDPVIHLGRLLLELGTIDDATFNATLTRCAKERRPHGQILLEENAIDTPGLLDALREQLMRKVLWLFELPPPSVYGFYEGANLLEKWGGPEEVAVEPLALIWRGIRAHESAKRIEQTVKRVAKKPLRLHPAAQLSRFCFSSREWAILDLIRARPQMLEQLVASGVDDETSVRRLVYALALTRSLDMGAHAFPVGVAGEEPARSLGGPPSSAPRAEDPTPPSLPPPRVAAGAAAPARPAPSPRVKPPLPASARQPTAQSEPPSSVRQVSPPVAPAIRMAPSPTGSSPRASAKPVQPLPDMSGAANAGPARARADSSPPSAETQSRTLRSETPDNVAPRRSPPVVVVKPLPSSPRSASSPTASAEPITTQHTPAPKSVRPVAPPLAPPPAKAAPPPPKAAPPAAPAISAEATAFIAVIRKKAEVVDSQNYYDILGVKRDTPGPDLSAAFFQLAKKWHPDRLGPEYAEVKDLAMRVFSRMNEAHQVLADEEKREQYNGVLDSGGGTAEDQEAVQKVMRAVTEYQKAEVLYKKRSLEAAEICARRAMEDDPEQADYVALYTVIASERRGDGRMDDLIAALDGAIRREPQNERARFARAQIYKRMNRMDVAIRDFRWVAEQNPRNLDAVREVRLYQMRRGAPPSSRSPGKDDKSKGGKGLFGKLFKR
ncbi:MAG: DnaJ domain-containing protein [Polyangiaceae bacterium]